MKNISDSTQTVPKRKKRKPMPTENPVNMSFFDA